MYNHFEKIINSNGIIDATRENPHNIVHVLRLGYSEALHERTLQILPKVVSDNHIGDDDYCWENDFLGFFHIE